MRTILTIAAAAMSLAPIFAHAGDDQTPNGAIGADGAVTGPIGDVNQIDRSVAGAIGADGAVVGPIGGGQINNRAVGASIGDSGAVLGPVGRNPKRAARGGLGTNGAVIGPVGGRVQENSLGGALDTSGAVTGPVGGYVGANGQDQRRPVLSIGGPVVPGRTVPQSPNTISPGGGMIRAIVNGHDVLMLPGSNQIFQVLN